MTKSLSENSERCEAVRNLSGQEAERSHSRDSGDDERHSPGRLQPATVAGSFRIGSKALRRGWVPLLVGIMGPWVEASTAQDRARVASLVRERSPRLAALRAQHQSLLLRAREAEKTRFPVVDAVATRTRLRQPRVATVPSLSPERTISQMVLEVDQPLWTGGRLSKTRDIAWLEAERGAEDLRTAELQEVRSAALAYLQWLGLNEQESILKKSVDFQSRYLNLTRSRKVRGAARDYELSQAEADDLAATARLAQIQQSLVAVEEQLKVALQLSAGEPLPVDTGNPLKAWKVTRRWGESAEALRDVAVQKRPDLKTSEIEKRLAHARKWLALSVDMPSLGLNGQVGYLSPDSSNLGSDASQMYSAGITLRIPLFSGLAALDRYRSGEQSVLAAERSWEDRLRLAENELRTELANVKVGQRLLDRHQAWVDAAERAVKQGIASYQQGTISSMQVLQLQSSVERAALALCQVRMDYLAAEVRLKAALGEDALAGD